jgi:hypothetical protein
MGRTKTREDKNVLLQREQLVAADEDLVTGLERGRDNALLGLDGEVHLVDGSENFVDLANGSLPQQELDSWPANGI